MAQRQEEKLEDHLVEGEKLPLKVGEELPLEERKHVEEDKILLSNLVSFKEFMTDHIPNNNAKI